MTSANLHLFLSAIQHETRLVKEARATLAMGLFSRVRVLGLWEDGLPVTDAHPSGMEIRRVRTLLPVLKARWTTIPSGLKRVLAALSLLQYALAAAWETLKLRPTHVSCHNLVLLPIAWAAAKLGGSKLIYVPHELEVERTGLPVSAKRLFDPLERVFIKSCASVVVVCEPIADWYRRRYLLRNVVVVRAIPDICLPASGATDRESIRRAHGVPEDALLFIYQGVLAAERGIDELLKTFCDLDDPRLHLMLMGYGEREARIKEAASRCPRIHFQAAVAMDQINIYSRAADVGIFVIGDPLSLSYQLCLPNKFFEYLYADLPVIVSENLRHLAEVVQSHNIGWVTSTERLSEFVKSVEPSSLAVVRPAVKAYIASNTWATERMHYRAVYAQ